MADTILTFSDFADEGVQFLTLPRLRSTPLHTTRRASTYAEYLAEWHGKFQGRALPPKPAGELPVAEAYVNCGRWVWKCICEIALIVEPGEDLICVGCGLGGWRSVVFPYNSEAIEEELLKLPGHRLNAPLRQWNTMWTLDYLRERVAKADAIIAETGRIPRALSIGSTRVWATGEVLTAANMNTFISQILDDLAGRNGVIELDDSISFLSSATSPLTLPRGTTAQRPSSPSNGMIRYNTTLGQVEFYNGDWKPLPTDTATFADLQANGLVGDGANQFAIGNHTHGLEISSSDFSYLNITAVTADTMWHTISASTDADVSDVSQRVGLVVSLSTHFSHTYTLDLRFRRTTTVIETLTGIAITPQTRLVRAYIDNPGTGMASYNVQARANRNPSTNISGVFLTALVLSPS